MWCMPAWQTPADCLTEVRQCHVMQTMLFSVTVTFNHSWVLFWKTNDRINICIIWYCIALVRQGLIYILTLSSVVSCIFNVSIFLCKSNCYLINFAEFCCMVRFSSAWKRLVFYNFVNDASHMKGCRLWWQGPPTD